VGITSWGNGCAWSAFPGIYTKLAVFRGWTDTQLRYGPHRSPYQRDTGGVTRLYLAYVGRYPDQTGMAHCWERINGGWSPARVSQAFAGSAEFRNRDGSLSNGRFVDLLYQNVLGRAADPGGRAMWVGHLDRGTKTRGEVMIGFSESLEFRRAKKAEVDVVITWFAMLRQAPAPASVATWRGRTNGALIAHLFDSATYHRRF
jgi:hypothetical protein